MDMTMVPKNLSRSMRFLGIAAEFLRFVTRRFA
jgi:hypothetical protein